MIYIHGFGCLSARGVGVGRLLEAIEGGEPLSKRSPPDAWARAGEAGWCEPLAAPAAFRARFGRFDRLTRLAVVAADQATAAAPAPPDPEAAGIVLGTAFGAHEGNDAFQQGLDDDVPSPTRFVYTLPSSAAAELSIHYRLQGPLEVLAHGVGAGLAALGRAAELIARGVCSWQLAGAADAVAPMLLRALDAPAAGPVVAEGAAFVVLSDRAPGALAAIAGVGRASGPGGRQRAMQAAVERAGLSLAGVRTRIEPEGPQADRFAAVAGRCGAAEPVLRTLVMLARGDALPAVVVAEGAGGASDAICIVQ